MSKDFLCILVIAATIYAVGIDGTGEKMEI